MQPVALSSYWLFVLWKILKIIDNSKVRAQPYTNDFR